jgi:hypothetical protein
MISLEIDHGGNIYTTGIGKQYKSGAFSPRELVSQHPTALKLSKPCLPNRMSKQTDTQ